jgi:hypothetical protein
LHSSNPCITSVQQIVSALYLHRCILFSALQNG